MEFLATVTERYCLNPGSERETYHLVVDLEGSGIEYAVGDCLGVYPQNDPETVNQIIESLCASGEETILDRKGNSFLLKDFLQGHANLGRLPTDTSSVEAFCKKLSPMLPRFYSIASSMSVVGKQAHLTVGLIDGTCSQYLCKRIEQGKPNLKIFHQKSHNFSLPIEADSKPIIMVGPGTGLAPFRGFIQERISRGLPAKNWLFFGERRRSTDFYYQTYLEKLVMEKKLDLTCAFSRDQEERIYVQHRMFEESRKLWNWIEEGAYLFVCGDASKMAKDVEKTLLEIIQNEGNLSAIEAKEFLKDLKKNNRYQRDIY